ncbi:MAG: thioredoxin family protein [Synechococcus sp.]
MPEYGAHYCRQTDSDILGSVEFWHLFLTKISEKVRNGAIAAAAILLGLGLFFASQFQGEQISLQSLAQQSVPLEVAQTNGKPTLIEFYADWCTSCRQMAPTVGELEEAFAGDINFVMLNVDNTKWLPELTNYRVNGIPHFEFLDESGQSLSTTIGEQPKVVLANNLTALRDRLPLANASTAGQVSSFEAPIGDSTQPRSHG